MSGKITQSNNFIYTALALITLLITASLVHMMPAGILEYIIEGLTLGTFGVCMLSLRFDKAWTRFMISIIICWFVASLLYRLFAIEMLDYLILVLMMVFFLGTFRSIARQILFVGDIDTNKVIGSITLFLLILSLIHI